MEKRLRIAYFSSYIEGDEFNELLWKNIERLSIERNFDLVQFPSINLRNDTQHEAIIREIFKFFNPELFDGVIISSSSLINYISEDIYIELTAKISLPAVSIGVKTSGFPSVVTDNLSGMRRLVEHLIKYHNFRKFIYISARKDHPEAVQRLNGFRDTLREYNAILSDDRILYGDFTKECVRGLLEPVLKEKKIEFEAVVCANDTMAKEAINILKENGYQIPRDIAVTGFDNSISANLQIPNITTVSQRADKITETALNLLFKQIDKEEYRSSVSIKPGIRINESCGCYQKSEKEDMPPFCLSQEHMEIIRNSINTEDSITIIKEIQQLLYTYSDNKMITSIKESVVNEISGYKTESNSDFINNVILKLIELFKENEIRTLLQNHIKFKEAMIETRVQFDRLLTSVDLPSFFKNVDTVFNIHKIGSYYILLYNNFSAADEIQLVHSVVDGINRNYMEKELNLKPEEFIPPELLPSLKRTNLVSLPLFSLNRCFGFIVMESENLDSGFIENLHMYLSATLMNILSLKQLKETQKLLAKSEKLAFLGNLVAGLAHEINTPLGISVTSASYIKQLTENLEKDFLNESLTKTTLGRFFNQSKDTFNLIDNGLNTTVKLVDRFKLISAKTDMESCSTFNLVEIIKRSIDNWAGKNDAPLLNIEFNSPEELYINSYPGIFYNILEIFFENTMTHGYESSSEIKIVIDLTRKDNKIVLKFRDFGRGCNRETIEQIFNPFFTTKRSRGFTGLGLTIVYNLVNTKLKGVIEGSSEKNVGLDLTITIPD